MAKLRALHNNIFNQLLELRRQNFDPLYTSDLFDRYATIRDTLKSEHASLFDDLPVREVPIQRTTDFEGRGLIKRFALEALLRDVNYCIDVLSSVSMVNLPSMMVTREGVFFAGQYFDALQRVREILSNAKQSIVIIDGYINEDVLNLVTSKNTAVEVKILTKSVSPALKTAADAFNRQYGNLSIRTSQAFHDRFLIVDSRDFYHFGASIKDLGNRGFMFSRIEEQVAINALASHWDQEWNRANVVV